MGLVGGSGAEIISDNTRVLEDEVLMDLVSELFCALANSDDNHAVGATGEKVSAIHFYLESSETNLGLT
jgi:hypothetical protein